MRTILKRSTSGRKVNYHHQETLKGFALLVIAGLLLVIATMGSVIYDKNQELDDLNGQIEKACRGVVAHLDLTEWVQLCKPYTEVYY